jgi:6-phosphogluconate dehydrogenase (decarboxylating)
LGPRQAMARFNATRSDSSAALYQRFSSRGEAYFADKVLSATRHRFGGHIEFGRTEEDEKD